MFIHYNYYRYKFTLLQQIVLRLLSIISGLIMIFEGLIKVLSFGFLSSWLSDDFSTYYTLIIYDYNDINSNKEKR